MIKRLVAADNNKQYTTFDIHLSHRASSKYFNTVTSKSAFKSVVSEDNFSRSSINDEEKITM